MLRKFRIKTRLLISFFIMAFFTLVVGLIGFARLTAIGNSAVKTVHNVTILNDIYDCNVAINSGVYNMVYVSDITLSKYVVQTTMAYTEKWLKYMNEYLAFQDQFSDVFTPGEMQDMANLLEIYEEAYVPVLYEIFGLIGQERREEALSIYINRFSPIYNAFTYYLNIGFSKNLQYSEIKTAKNNENAYLSARLMLVVVLVSLIVSVMLALAVTRSIANPLVGLGEAAEKAANGERDVRFELSESNDEIARLSLRLQETLRHLSQVQQLKLEAIEAQHEKEKAEALARSKGDFLAKMSHEIRTPMNAIIGMAELALRENMPESGREHILTIKQAGTNLLSILNDILDFSKIESGKLEIVPTDYLFSSLINDVISIIRTKVIDSEILFVVNVDRDIPNELFGDEIRVRQALLNILSNAVKYTEKGFVSLTVAGETINENTVSLAIEVADSGRGIKEEDIGKLFRDFVQIDLSGNRGIEGTGLGLAITRSIINAMNGEIFVNSEFGKGSAFTVRLPQTIRGVKKLSFVEAPETKSVLLYEQREIYSSSILRSLENLGVKCAHVGNNSEFAEKLKSQRWPFVFISSGLLERAAKTIEENGSGARIVALARFGEVPTGKVLDVLTMPAYSIPIANILNGTATGSAFSASREVVTSFIAPDAKVLVVDDINTNLKVAEGLMLPYKMRVELCGSGPKAIEAVKQKSYDLVFMDHMMPEMDGIEAVSVIRAMEGERFKTMPIIALTANVISGMRELFISRGFNDLLAKPIDIFKLDEILSCWITEEKKKQGNVDRYSNRDSPVSSPMLPIPGVDVQHGIAMTGGTLEGYRQVLSIFSEDAECRLPMLQKAPEAEALAVFTTQVHALKSASASIGAAEISVQAAALEAAGKAGDLELIWKKLPAFAECLAELVKNIRVTLMDAGSQDAPPDSPGLSPVIPARLLRELEVALNAQDLSSIDRILAELDKEPLDPKAKKIMEQISDDVLMAEFEKAAAALENLQEIYRS
jgi:signal transduction histidine kinase/CheY-like chemotaxis protein